MKITHEFTVSVPPAEAWAVLTDLEAIAPCMPGASLTGFDGETYLGKVRVKLGPVISDFAGTARFASQGRRHPPRGDRCQGQGLSRGRQRVRPDHCRPRAAPGPARW